MPKPKPKPKPTPAPTPAPTPSLAELDPAAVALEATRAAAERASRLALPLSPSVRLDLGDTSDTALAATDLAATFRALTAYAQKGLPVWDWTSDEDAADALLGASELMFAAPGRDWTPVQLDAVLSPGRDEKPPVPVLVLACAWTRVQIARGDAVRLASLAWLASVSHERVHQYVRSGRLSGVIPAHKKGYPAMVTADGATEWLAMHSRGPEERKAAKAAEREAAKAAKAAKAAEREAAEREAAEAARAELADRIRAAAAGGGSARAVARALGVHKEWLRRKAKALGVELPRGVPGRSGKRSKA